MEIDAWSLWYRVMDRMDKFSGPQRAAIELIKQNDSKREEKIEEWRTRYPQKQFKEGVIVKVHGLTSKKEWNGRKGKIVGPGRNGSKHFYRWEVMLFGKPKQQALLKQSNIKIIKCNRTNEIIA